MQKYKTRVKSRCEVYNETTLWKDVAWQADLSYNHS